MTASKARHFLRVGEDEVECFIIYQVADVYGPAFIFETAPGAIRVPIGNYPWVAKEELKIPTSTGEVETFVIWRRCS